MKKAFKYRIDTSKAVERKLEETLDICRELYNAGLSERCQAYKLAGKSIGYIDQANQLPEIKTLRQDLKGVHSQVLQDVLKRLDKAFEAFFRRLKNGQTAGYPRFKS